MTTAEKVAKDTEVSDDEIWRVYEEVALSYWLLKSVSAIVRKKMYHHVQAEWAAKRFLAQETVSRPGKRNLFRVVKAFDVTWRSRRIRR